MWPVLVRQSKIDGVADLEWLVWPEDLIFYCPAIRRASFLVWYRPSFYFKSNNTVLVVRECHLNFISLDCSRILKFLVLLGREGIVSEESFVKLDFNVQMIKNSD